MLAASHPDEGSSWRHPRHVHNVPWASECEDVAKLKIKLCEAK